jgi:DNA segregation ATPase FtsK/SpoIIIE, S-DNA-T family
VELFVVDGPDAGRSFSLAAESVIGRDPTAAIRLTDEEVSRRHAIITLGEGSAVIEDLGSVNGTHTDAGPVVGELGGPDDPENLKPTKASLPTA